MRSPRSSLFVLALLAACTTRDARRADTATAAAATLAGVPTPDAAAVRQTIDAENARLSAAIVKGDTAALAGFYGEDALFLPPGMKAAHGHGEIAQSFAAIGSAVKITGFTLQAQDVLVTGDYAVETGAYDMTIQPKSGAPAHDIGKYLTLWKKQADGGYKIVRDIFNSDGPAK